MGCSVLSPLLGENPIDFMYRNNQGFYTELYISNMAGWSERVKPQIEVPYLLEGSLTEEGILTAKSLIKVGWDEPNWDYDYMNTSFDVWQDMEKTWDKGPEKKALTARPVFGCKYETK